MTSKALLDENPSPTEEEIKEALSGNFCRCISHYQVLRAVMADRRRRGDEHGLKLQVHRKITPRRDAKEIVTGSANYLGRSEDVQSAAREGAAQSLSACHHQEGRQEQSRGAARRQGSAHMGGHARLEGWHAPRGARARQESPLMLEMPWRSWRRNRGNCGRGA